VYLLTIQTAAPVVNEIQSITTMAERGQTLSGGFRLKYGDYTTPFLAHDIKPGVREISFILQVHSADFAPRLAHLSQANSNEKSKTR